MTDISQITLLIAVIALALWPVVLFVLRFLHERRKKLECIERMTKDELDDITTKDLVVSVLKKIGCQPSENEEGNIVFKYQGDDFYIAAEEENRFIMIWNPWWGSISADNEALPYLKEIINIININSLVTTMTMVDEDDEKTIGIHSRCHTYFSPNEGELEEHLKMLLDMFFDTHNAIKENLNQLGAAAATAEVQKERVKVKGFAAYKENSTTIESQQTETAAVTEQTEKDDAEAAGSDAKAAGSDAKAAESDAETAGSDAEAAGSDAEAKEAEEDKPNKTAAEIQPQNKAKNVAVKQNKTDKATVHQASKQQKAGSAAVKQENKQ